jgi:hypothetical protein
MAARIEGDDVFDTWVIDQTGNDAFVGIKGKGEEIRPSG